MAKNSRFRSCGCECFFDPVVAFGFELFGKFCVATVNDTTVEHNMHDVRYDVVEQALVVSDDEKCTVISTHHIHTFGDNA